MPVNIGAKPLADFNDPLGVLTDCHRRIEQYIRLLVSVSGQVTDAAPNREQREALETSLQYFRHAAPKHILDEEESLFPRLRLARDPRVVSVLKLLQQLSIGHDLADDMHHEIERLFVRWFLDGAISTVDRLRVTELLDNLASFYDEHIAFEEQEAFPLASIILSKEQLQSIGREMAERRGAQFQIHEPVPA
jgi:hemerythrin-like domain-containing protein